MVVLPVKSLVFTGEGAEERAVSVSVVNELPVDEGEEVAAEETIVVD